MTVDCGDSGDSVNADYKVFLFCLNDTLSLSPASFPLPSIKSLRLPLPFITLCINDQGESLAMGGAAMGMFPILLLVELAIATNEFCACWYIDEPASTV